MSPTSSTVTGRPFVQQKKKTYEDIKGKAVSDVGDFLDLNQLSEGCVGSVKVLICRKWDSISSYGKYISTEYILSDDKGNVIQCSVRSNIAHCFVGKLEEGQIYSLKNFSLVANKEKFRIRNTDRYIIELEGYTVVRKLECTSTGFERFPFQLAPFDDIDLNDSCYLIDVIGYVVDVGMLKKIMKGSELLDCDIMNDRSARLRVTVWGSLCSDLIRRKGHSEHYVAIFTSMNVKEFRGKERIPPCSLLNRNQKPKMGRLQSCLVLASICQLAHRASPLQYTAGYDSSTYTPKMVGSTTSVDWEDAKKSATPIGNKFWCGTCKKEPEFPRTRSRVENKALTSR